MTKELDDFKVWVASRKEAGRNIDIHTCEIHWQYVQVLDPYDLRAASGDPLVMPGMPEDQIGCDCFVCGPDSDGWIFEGDLPAEKLEALHERIKRGASNGRRNGDEMSDDLPF
jgi:hypothetical protein